MFDFPREVWIRKCISCKLTTIIITERGGVCCSRNLNNLTACLRIYSKGDFNRSEIKNLERFKICMVIPLISAFLVFMHPVLINLMLQTTKLVKQVDTCKSSLPLIPESRLGAAFKLNSHKTTQQRFQISSYLVCRLDILFLSNHNVQKSLFGICVRAPDPLTNRFQ